MSQYSLDKGRKLYYTTEHVDVVSLLLIVVKSPHDFRSVAFTNQFVAKDRFSSLQNALKAKSMGTRLILISMS